MSAAHEKPEWAQSKRDKMNAERVAQGLKPKRRVWPWVLLALIVVAIVASMFLAPPPVVEDAADADAPFMRQIRADETATIEPTRLRETVKVTGTLVPAERADVASQASGRVISVMVRPGDTVREGDILAQIDRANLELQLNQQRANANATRAQLQSSQQQLERSEQLASQGLTSPSALEQARSATAALASQMEALNSAVEAAELALANATVKSPLSGVVSSRSVEPGQTIQAGTPLFSIVNLSKIEFQAAASVNSSARVVAGQSATIHVTGLENEEFPGQVSRVNPVAMIGTRTVPIYIDINNANGRLRGGMFATGQIVITEKPDAIAVPTSAVREDAEGQFVMKLVDNRLERQAIEIVREWNRGAMLEVTGVNVGDVIVSAPLSDLEPGSAFTLVEG
jgi:membrane fusion protein (multidrug efflux system)